MKRREKTIKQSIKEFLEQHMGRHFRVHEVYDALRERGFTELNPVTVARTLRKLAREPNNIHSNLMGEFWAKLEDEKCRKLTEYGFGG